MPHRQGLQLDWHGFEDQDTFLKNTDARIGVLSIKRFKTGMGWVVVR